MFVILLPLGDSVDSHFVFIVSSHHLGLPWWRLQVRRRSWGGVSLCGGREASLQQPAGCEYRSWWVLFLALFLASLTLVKLSRWLLSQYSEWSSYVNTTYFYELGSPYQQTSTEVQHSTSVLLLCSQWCSVLSPFIDSYVLTLWHSWAQGLSLLLRFVLEHHIADFQYVILLH